MTFSIYGFFQIVDVVITMTGVIPVEITHITDPIEEVGRYQAMQTASLKLQYCPIMGYFPMLCLFRKL